MNWIGPRQNKGRKGATPSRAAKPTPGVLIPAPPPSDEARVVASYLADEIKHAVVIAATSPLNERFPERSYAAIMQDYLKKNSSKQESIRTKARSMLAAPLAKRKTYFGRFADKDASLQKKVSTGADTTLERSLKRAFESELEKHDSYNSAGVLGRMNAVPILKTILKIDLTSGEFQGSYWYRTKLDIYQPERLWFHWETKETEATFGQWEMKFPRGQRAPTERGPAGKVAQGKFDIDFHKFLAETPPLRPQTFLVRVQPMKAFPITGSVAAKKPEPVGEPSNWVSITYTKGPEQPEFELPPEDTGHYQQIQFYINSVKCIEETGEASASDEILLGGFHTLSDGRVIQQGTWTVSEDFDQGEVEPEPSHRPILWAGFKLFSMEFPSGNLLGQEPIDNSLVPWPKAYAFTLVMFERDGGGFEEIIANLIIKVIDWINNWIKGAIEGYLAQYIGQEAAQVVASIVGGILGYLFGLFKELLDDPDDLIAQNTYILWLESSRVSFIHSLPGQVNDLGQAFGLPTKQTEFVSNPQVLRFEGGEASAGGVYDVEVFWKANRRYFNY